jgi:hypothetical protein
MRTFSLLIIIPISTKSFTMYFIFKTTAILSLLALHSSATTVPALSPLKRGGGANCYGGGKLYSNTDANTLSHNLQNLNPNTMHYLQHQSGCFGWTVGSVRGCVENEYITENTHVSEWEVGWGIAFIQQQCCNSIDGRW